MVRNLNADDDERSDDEDLNIPLQTEPFKAPVKRREDVESVMASLRTVHHKQTDKVQIKRRRPLRQAPRSESSSFESYSSNYDSQSFDDESP